MWRPGSSKLQCYKDARWRLTRLSRRSCLGLYGLPILVAADLDGCFQGDFQARPRGARRSSQTLPSGWKITHVERQNAFLRIIIEKLVDTFSATTIAEMDLLLAPALHAAKSTVLSRGRSAFQAMFGDVPRLYLAASSRTTKRWQCPLLRTSPPRLREFVLKPLSRPSPTSTSSSRPFGVPYFAR